MSHRSGITSSEELESAISQTRTGKNRLLQVTYCMRTLLLLVNKEGR